MMIRFLRRWRRKNADKRNNKEERKKTTEVPIEVIADILSRLPAKTLLRFKTVSKSWYNLISEPWFVNLHRRRSRRNPNVLYVTYEQKHNIFGQHRTTLTFTSADYEWNVSQVFTKSMPSCGRFDFFHCVSSYNDMICFMTTIVDRCEHIYLYNPVSHRVFALPERKICVDLPHSTIGFGYVSSTREYKVLRMFTNGEFDAECEIITFCPDSNGRNPCSSWREITHENFSGPVPIPGGPVSVHECLHWLTQGYSGPSTRGEVITSFNLRTEKFSTIPLPSELNDCLPSDNLLSLIVDDFEGKLNLFKHQSTVFASLWVLEDYDKHIWNRKHNIDFLPMYPRIFDEYHMCQYMVNGELLILWSDSEKNFCSHYLYNVKNHCFRRVSAPKQGTSKSDSRFGFYWESMNTL